MAMARRRFQTGLAVVGGCAALAVVLPPLAGLLNLVAGATLLALAAYAGYRAWAFMEAVVEASRRPATVRRNLHQDPEGPRRQRPREREPAPEREFRARHLRDRIPAPLRGR